jgi:tetratricopeptide (TPR) repeat protein
MRALVAAMLLSSLAHADDMQSAKAHFRQGKAFHEIGAYDQAIAEFEAAYAQAALPELVFNIARSLQKKGESEKALVTYRHYLELDPEGRVADDARREVALLTVQLQKAKTTVVDAPPPVVVVQPPPPPPKSKRRTAIAVGVTVGALVLTGVVVGVAVGVTQSTSPFSSAVTLPKIGGP